MAGIKHKKQITEAEEQSPACEINRNEWNDEHDLGDLNLGYFPMMLAETVPTINTLDYNDGLGTEIFVNYAWNIIANPMEWYETMRYFGIPFRKIPFYVMGFKCDLLRPLKSVSVAEYEFYIKKSRYGASQNIYGGYVNDNNFAEGWTYLDVDFETPVLIDLAWNLNYYWWFYIESKNANQQGILLREFLIKTKLEI